MKPWTAGEWQTLVDCACKARQLRDDARNCRIWGRRPAAMDLERMARGYEVLILRHATQTLVELERTAP